uniref:TBC1 domain family member 19 isoform X3 n=1 Tax=Myxine glutinosa TaxID=7769 RepID=UPI00358E30DE
MDLEFVALSVAQVVCKLRNSHLYGQMHREALVELRKKEVHLSTLKTDLKLALQKSGWRTKLNNAVFRELGFMLPSQVTCSCTPAGHQAELPLAYMKRAQSHWEQRVMKSLDSMCLELGIAPSRKRLHEGQQHLWKHWNEMSTENFDVRHIRPVYAPKDFLEVLIHLRSSNSEVDKLSSSSGCRGLIQVPLRVNSILELREMFAELHLREAQTGLDDSSQLFPSSFFETERQNLGDKVLSMGESSAAQCFARKGCPTGLRAKLWLLALGISPGPEDVKLTASNDDYYFVFEDYLYQVLLCFSRDASILEYLSTNGVNQVASFQTGWLRSHVPNGEEHSEVGTLKYSPNGVIPFHGFAMYAAPLCLLYNEPPTLYGVFREMYTKFFYRLHCVSSHASGIVKLCLLFESLVKVHQPQLFLHLHDVGAPPLRIAFKWLVRAFSGYLATDQVLLLWDRMLGFGSTQILAVLAAAVFILRAENLMESSNLLTAEAVVADLSTIKVIPLLQLLLFATDTP